MAKRKKLVPGDMIDQDMEDAEGLAKYFFGEYDRLSNEINNQYQQILSGNVRVEREVQGLSFHIDEHGKKIDSLEGEVKELRTEVTKQPLMWNQDIDEKIDKNNTKRNEIGAAIENVKNQNKRNNHSSGSSVAPPSAHSSNGSRGIALMLKAFLPYIILGLTAIGGYVAVRFGGDDEALAKAVKSLQSVEDQVKKLNERDTRFELPPTDQQDEVSDASSLP